MAISNRRTDLFACTLAICLITSSSSYAFAIDDLNRLRLTKQCARCDLRDADVAEMLRLQAADRAHADPRNAAIASAFARVDLTGANLVGANLVGAKFAGVPLDYADLSYADLSGANLGGASFYGANLGGTKLIGTNLSTAKLDGANLTGSVLVDADLRQASLQYATLSVANMRGAQLSNANLSGARMEGSILIDAVLNKTDLTGADLTGANLHSAKLGGATMIGTGLRDTNLGQSDQVFLVGLREELKKNGHRQQEREVTYAIKKYSQASMPPLEWLFHLILFDLTAEYGASPGRPLRILLGLIFVFTFPYAFSVRDPLSASGIWRVWPKDRVQPRPDEDQPSKLISRQLTALPWGLYFSLLSAFHFGWRDLNVGNWLARIHRREYVLRATGWVRVVSGVQSIISIYLVALWVLTYFGRPFD